MERVLSLEFMVILELIRVVVILAMNIIYSMMHRRTPIGLLIISNWMAATLI